MQARRMSVPVTGVGNSWTCYIINPKSLFARLEGLLRMPGTRVLLEMCRLNGLYERRSDGLEPERYGDGAWVGDSEDPPADVTRSAASRFHLGGLRGAVFAAGRRTGVRRRRAGLPGRPRKMRLTRGSGRPASCDRPAPRRPGWRHPRRRHECYGPCHRIIRRRLAQTRPAPQKEDPVKSPDVPPMAS